MEAWPPEILRRPKVRQKYFKQLAKFTASANLLTESFTK
jgi:hypothetical protein